MPFSLWSLHLNQSVFLVPTASAASGNLLESQSIRSHPRCTESETLGVRSQYILTSPPCDSEL